MIPSSVDRILICRKFPFVLHNLHMHLFSLFRCFISYTLFPFCVCFIRKNRWSCCCSVASPTFRAPTSLCLRQRVYRSSSLPRMRERIVGNCSPVSCVWLHPFAHWPLPLHMMAVWTDLSRLWKGSICWGSNSFEWNSTDKGNLNLKMNQYNVL